MCAGPRNLIINLGSSPHQFSRLTEGVITLFRRSVYDLEFTITLLHNMRFDLQYDYLLLQDLLNAFSRHLRVLSNLRILFLRKIAVCALSCDPRPGQGPANASPIPPAYDPFPCPANLS